MWLPQSRYKTRILRENRESFQNSRFCIHSSCSFTTLGLPYIMGALNKLIKGGNGALHVQQARGHQTVRTKAKKCFMVLSATFQFTIVNFKKLYLLGFLLNWSEKDLGGNLRNSFFTWLKLQAIWINRFRDTRKSYNTCRLRQFLKHRKSRSS